MSWWADGVYLYHHRIFKSLLWITLIVAFVIMVPTVFCAGLDNWAINYEAARHPPAAPIVINTDANGKVIITPAPTTAATNLETINIDIPALSMNNNYPTPFSRTDSDPVGAYFAIMNFGSGPFPGVYIVPNKWEQAGGRVVVPANGVLPTSGTYYTIYTHIGTSRQAIYDRQKNIIYSMILNPDILQ